MSDFFPGTIRLTSGDRVSLIGLMWGPGPDGVGAEVSLGCNDYYDTRTPDEFEWAYRDAWRQTEHERARIHAEVAADVMMTRMQAQASPEHVTAGGSWPPPTQAPEPEPDAPEPAPTPDADDYRDPADLPPVGIPVEVKLRHALWWEAVGGGWWSGTGWRIMLNTHRCRTTGAANNLLIDASMVLGWRPLDVS
jgi:hypothetical protein